MYQKSSFCRQGTCVEVAYHKPTRSSKCSGGDCVEVASCTCDEVRMRDSKNTAGPVLVFPRQEWTAFIAGIKDDEFSLLG